MLVLSCVVGLRRTAVRPILVLIGITWKSFQTNISAVCGTINIVYCDSEESCCSALSNIKYEKFIYSLHSDRIHCVFISLGIFIVLFLLIEIEMSALDINSLLIEQKPLHVPALSDIAEGKH